MRAKRARRGKERRTVGCAGGTGGQTPDKFFARAGAGSSLFVGRSRAPSCGVPAMEPTGEIIPEKNHGCVRAIEKRDAIGFRYSSPIDLLVYRFRITAAPVSFRDDFASNLSNIMRYRLSSTFGKLSERRNVNARCNLILNKGRYVSARSRYV